MRKMVCAIFLRKKKEQSQNNNYNYQQMRPNNSYFQNFNHIPMNNMNPIQNNLNLV